MMHSRVTNSSGMPSAINIQPIYVSSALNTRLSLVTSVSNSTRPKMANDKLKTWETKTQNAINSDKQTKSQDPSLESTCGKAEEGTMSSQTKTNLFENGSKIFRKEPLIYRGFQNARGTGDRNFLQPTSKCVFRNDTNIYYESEQSKNNEKNSVLNMRSILTDSKNMDSVMIKGERVICNPKKSSSTGANDPNANLLRHRRKQENPQKNVRFLIVEKENSDRAYKIQLQSDFAKKELTNMQDRNSTSSSQVPRIRILSNTKPQYSQNYAHSSNSRAIKLKDISNLNSQKSRILYTGESTERINPSQSEPLFYSLFNRDRNAVLRMPHYEFQRPFFYRQSGTATRGGDVVRGRYRLIVPKQIMVKSGETAFNDRKKADHIVRSTVCGKKFRNPMTNLDPFRTYHQQNYQVQPNAVRSGVGNQKYENSLDVTSFGLPSSFGELRNQVQLDTANTEKISRTNILKTLLLKIQDGNNKPSTSGHHACQTTSTDERQKVSAHNQSNHQEQHEENTDNHKIEAAKEALTRISELLCDISGMLSKEFECPVELEISLPVWKAELELCMMSAEKIKTAISKFEKEKK